MIQGSLAYLQEFEKLFDDHAAFHHTTHQLKWHLPKSLQNGIEGLRFKLLDTTIQAGCHIETYNFKLKM